MIKTLVRIIVLFEGQERNITGNSRKKNSEKNFFKKMLKCSSKPGSFPDVYDCVVLSLTRSTQRRSFYVK